MSDVGPGMLDRLQAALPLQPDWSIREGRSLQWWPCELQQTISVGEPRSHMGSDVCKLTIGTRLVRDVEVSSQTLSALARLNRMACSSALILDEADRSMELSTCFYIHVYNLRWTAPLVIFAAVAQAAEAQHLMGGPESVFCEDSRGGRKAVCVHPVSGVRAHGDDMQAVIRRLSAGAPGAPFTYGLVDVQESTGSFGPDPSLMTNFDEGGLAAEFQFHGRTSAVDRYLARLLGRRSPALGSALFEAETCARHPRYGPGCLTVLTLPVTDEDPQLINQLNLQERDDWTRAQGMGAWCLGERGIAHAAFLPVAVRRRGLFGMVYRNAAVRAGWAGRFLA